MISNTNNKKLITKSILDIKLNKYQNVNEEQEEQHQLFYLSDYRYGGCTTFTAHLLHLLNIKSVICLTDAFEKDIGDFGYGICYQKRPIAFLDSIKRKRMFIADMYQNFHLLEKLKNKDITIVVHDACEIFKENEHYLKNWKIIVIRKTVKDYLKSKYDIISKFVYHPFYPYKRILKDYDENNSNDNYKTEEEEEAGVSISRIEYHKNTDIILKANKKLKKPIKIYGLTNPQYVSSKLNKLDFNKYYQGIFEKSFSSISNILSKSKFMVDLSQLPNDGGGTQYTFLEAIYNNSAIILNRKWIENIDKKYCDFKEDYNCYAVSNEQELIELMNNSNNIDTAKINQNARKLMHRHINTAEESSKMVTY